MCAALIGSGVGLGLGAIYMAGGMARVAEDHGRSERIAEVADGGFSESVLQRQAAGMPPAALRLARNYHPLAAEADFDRTPDLRLGPPSTGHSGSPVQSARELDCLTQAVYFEARGETSRGQAAVATVVLNRVKSPAFPKTVCGVVFQGASNHGCQFSFACDGSLHHGRETGAWDRARLIAARALSGVVLSDIGSATHFHTTRVSPGWGPQMLRVAQVGLHVFYRFNPNAPASRPMVEHAVFVGLPMQPMAGQGGLRLATALVAKTVDVTIGVVADQATTPEPKAATGQATDVAARISRTLEPATGSAS